MSKPTLSLLDLTTNNRLVISVDAETLDSMLTILFKPTSGTVALESDLAELEIAINANIQTVADGLTTMGKSVYTAAETDIAIDNKIRVLTELAPADLDTFKEIATKFQLTDNELDSVLTAISGKVAQLDFNSLVDVVAGKAAASDLTALATAMAGKISSNEKGAANGVATLDAGGKVPASQLPTITSGPVIYNFTATAGQTAFLTTGDTLSATPIVILNGSVQQINVTYTVAAKTVTFLEARVVNDSITILG